MADQENNNTYTRADLNNAYSRGVADGEATIDTTTHKIVSFLADGGGFFHHRDEDGTPLPCPDVPLKMRLKMAWHAFRAPDAVLGGACIAAAKRIDAALNR